MVAGSYVVRREPTGGWMEFHRQDRACAIPTRRGVGVHVAGNPLGNRMMTPSMRLLMVCFGVVGGFACGCDDTSGGAGSTPPSVERPDSSRIRYYRAHTGEVLCVAASSDGKYFATGGEDGRVLVRSVEAPERNLRVLGPYGDRDEFRRVTSVSFSQDGASVLVAGEFIGDDCVMSAPVTGSGEKRLELGDSLGSIRLARTVNGGSFLVYLSVDTFFLRDLKTRTMEAWKKIKDGYVLGFAVSPGRNHVAAFSQRAEKGWLVGPCRLRALHVDTSGRRLVQTLLYEYEQPRWSRQCQVVFAGTNHLVLCTPSGKMVTWTWSEEKRAWKDRHEIAIPPGFLSASAGSETGRSVWLTRWNSIVEIDIVSGRVIRRIQFDFPEPKPIRPFYRPIASLAVIPKKNLLLLGLRDGRIALVPIAHKSEKRVRDRAKPEQIP